MHEPTTPLSGLSDRGRDDRTRFAGARAARGGARAPRRLAPGRRQPPWTHGRYAQRHPAPPRRSGDPAHTCAIRGSDSDRRKTSIDSECHLLREYPELARALSAKRRALAEDACTARTLNVRRGRWNQPAGDLREAVGLLVLEGLLLRRVTVEGRAGAELLGSGDVVRPWEDGPEAKLRRATAWRALQVTRLAVLDDSAVEHLAQYPEIMRRLLERSLERSRRLAVNMAIVHQPRVDIRPSDAVLAPS